MAIATKIPNLDQIRPIVVDDLMRMGRDHDGGYVVSARTVTDAAVLVGLGINTDWSFETDFLRRNPMADLIAVDGSVSTTRFKRDAWRLARKAVGAALRGKQSQSFDALYEGREAWRMSKAFTHFFFSPNRLFVEKMVGDRNSGGGTVCWDNLVTLVNTKLRRGAEKKWFVKMDIEGAEYIALPELLQQHQKISGIAIEFHDCGENAERFDDVIAQLKSQFVVVHVHGNNHAPLIPGTNCPTVIEVTLMHRKLATNAELAAANTRTYPLPDLDQPNHADRPDYVFI